MTLINLIKELDAVVANADGVINLIVRLFNLYKSYNVKKPAEEVNNYGRN